MDIECSHGRGLFEFSDSVILGIYSSTGIYDCQEAAENPLPPVFIWGTDRLSKVNQESIGQKRASQIDA